MASAAPHRVAVVLFLVRFAVEPQLVPKLCGSRNVDRRRGWKTKESARDPPSVSGLRGVWWWWGGRTLLQVLKQDAEADAASEEEERSRNEVVPFRSLLACLCAGRPQAVYSGLGMGDFG